MIITLPCFLHQLNTVVSKIVMFAGAKAAISGTTQVVSFFICSYYWGGQEANAAKEQGITKQLKTHTDTRWYSFILQNVIFQLHKFLSLHMNFPRYKFICLDRSPLKQICN
jgi:hypothetical protein